jgi:hypothetical protein
MLVAPCDLPPDTALDRDLVEGACFTDSYRVPLTHGSATVVDIFFAVFGHHPGWLKAVLLVRHRVGAWFGLQAASTAEVMSPSRASSYQVGQHIGPWPIYFLSEGELVAGRDNKHLDFRLPVLKHGSGPSAAAVVSTVCRTHNAFGRVYLLAIAPFHKWGVQSLLRRASQAGRL